MTISIGNARSATLGVGASSSYSATKVGTGNVTATALTAGMLSINGFQVGASVSDGVSSVNADASGISKAAAINAISGQTGVNATVGATTKVGIAATAFGATAAGDVLINGVDIGIIPAGTAAGDRGTQTAAAVNAKSSQTGVTAAVDTAGVVTLTAADGRNITVFTTANGGARSGLTAAGGGTEQERSKLTLTSSTSAGITVGGNDGWAAAGLNITAVAATTTAGAGVSSLDLTTAAGAQRALASLDKAINTITDSRAAMGAYQNRLNASISNLETASLNLQASRSRIMDTDYAKESTNLAKSQIIAQAATAMLAQANQSQQSVLALLK